jgi:5-(carboxyamino)imidazole ribonucleotide mutase
MAYGTVAVVMGSPRDHAFASRIGAFVRDEQFEVDVEYVVASAHKTPRKLLAALAAFEKAGGPRVVITVAGLSDALSGTVAGSSRFPVIACPPDAERFGYAKFFSSVMTPQGVAVVYVPRPENAALTAVKILALSSPTLQRQVTSYMRRLKAGVRPRPGG